MVGGETEQDGGLAGGEGARLQDMPDVCLSFALRWAPSPPLALFGASFSVRAWDCAVDGTRASSCRLHFVS